MRAIKFRAWIDGELCDVDEFGFTDGVLTEVSAGDHEVWHANIALEVGVVELEQYTGLKDENGKGIFEGDIVHVWNEGTGVMTFKNGLFALAFDPDNESSLTADTWPLGTWSPEDYEVLGNIHDNSELLEGGRKGD